MCSIIIKKTILKVKLLDK